MTDHFTYELFVNPNANNKIVCSNVSRLIIDVERFEDDCIEPMAAIGMGVIYTSTSSLKPLRRAITADERTYLMAEYYHPHHRALESAVNESLENHGQCLIIDCHSFPNTALPYENVDKSILRPDICIGTDSFHTSDALRKAFTDAFSNSELKVAINTPFAGSMVPVSRYRKDERVQSIMIEVNRDLYLDPMTFKKKTDFDAISKLTKAACCHALIDRWVL
jgi:N-formylglutamate amidohydrolase